MVLSFLRNMLLDKTPNNKKIHLYDIKRLCHILQIKITNKGRSVDLPFILTTFFDHVR